MTFSRSWVLFCKQIPSGTFLILKISLAVPLELRRRNLVYQVLFQVELVGYNLRMVSNCRLLPIQDILSHQLYQILGGFGQLSTAARNSNPTASSEIRPLNFKDFCQLVGLFI